MAYFGRGLPGARDTRTEDRVGLRMALLLSAGSILGTVVVVLALAYCGLLPTPDPDNLPWTIEQSIALL